MTSRIPFAKMLALSLFAPTHAAWQTAKAAHPEASTPFRRLGGGLRWEMILAAVGATVVVAGSVTGYGLALWIGIAWLALASFEIAARFTVPAHWVIHEEQFQSVFSPRGLIRAAILLLFVRALLLADWLGAAILASVLVTFWVQGLGVV